MKKPILFLFSLILLSACSINININQDKKNSEATPTPISIPAQTSTPASAPTPTLQPKPNITQQLTTFFANKFAKPKANVILTISKNTGSHATGGIKFTGEMGGGMWLAYKDNSGDWQVVYDGHGTIPCTSVEPHNFPSSIITECWDEANSKIKHL